MKNKIDFSNPPAGKIYVPIPTNEEDIKLSGIDRRYVTMHTFSATKILCKMELVDATEVEAVHRYIEDIKTECKRKERQHRCVIESPKTGKKIVCPDNCRCGTDSCPRKDKSEMDDVERAAPISYEQWQEDSGSDVGAYDSTAETAIASATYDAFIDMLRAKNPALAVMVKMLEGGKSADEIMTELSIKKTRFYEMRNTLKNLYKEFFQA